MKQNPRNKLKIVRIVLIVAVVALLSGVAYALYDANRSDKADESTTRSEGQEPEEQNNEEPKPGASTKTFTAKALGATFVYPASWKAASQPGTDPNDPKLYNVYVDAPNTKFDTSQRYPTIVSGARITVTKTDLSGIEGVPTTLTAYKKSANYQQLSQNARDITVDGEPGVARDALYEGPVLYAVTVFHDGVQYDVMTQKTLYEKNKKVFDDIVSSIKFN